MEANVAVAYTQFPELEIAMMARALGCPTTSVTLTYDELLATLPAAIQRAT